MTDNRNDKDRLFSASIKSGADDKPRDFGDNDWLSVLSGDTMNWISGNAENKPEDLRKMGEDLTVKMNWYVACTILSSYSRIPALMKSMDEVGAKLMSPDRIKRVTDTKTLSEMYTSIGKEINQITEFARKFVIQNKDELADSNSFFDRTLYEKIKAMPMDRLRLYLDFFQLVEQKGDDFLINILKENKK